MIIKEKKFKKCSKCGHKEMISDEEYGCDYCKKEIIYDDSGDSRSYLNVGVFFQDGHRSKDVHCCSWDCVFAILEGIKTDYFINLPYLSFDEPRKELSAKGFWEAIKKLQRRQ